MTVAKIPHQVLEALTSGNKIEAIKRLREATGLGLKEAKDAVEAYERGESVSFELNVTEVLEPQRQDLVRVAQEALRDGSKIEAIKKVREATGAGLAEAKGIVEAIERQAPKSAPKGRHLAPGETPSGGGVAKWVALIAVGVIAIVAALYY